MTVPVREDCESEFIIADQADCLIIVACLLPAGHSSDHLGNLPNAAQDDAAAVEWMT